MNLLSESQTRLYEKIYRDLGNDIISFLEDDDINEIMLNPDGKLWIDSTKQGQVFIQEMPSPQALSIVNGIAGLHHCVISFHSPRLEAELPFFKSMNGERFTAQIPPIVSSPSFTIRKRSNIIFTLRDYHDSGRLTTLQEIELRCLVSNRKNILVCGGPGVGKTTVTNALIHAAVTDNANQRFILLEDLPELQCSAPNKVSMLTSNAVNMTDLLKTAMRMRPDRILIGEVRGREALDMLKAWNTGCPGGICTVHANGAEEAIQRILDLAMEAGLTVPPIALVLQTIDAIVFVNRAGNQKGFIQSILKLKGYGNEKFIFEKLA